MDIKTTTFTYDGDGNRIRKVSGNTTVDYIVIGGTIYGEIHTVGTTTTSLHYLFDENGTRFGFVLNGTETYYYRFNLQGDVTGIYDATGALVVEYTYDAWGKVLSVTGSNATLGTLNPIRYRGYYYDSETGFYYLQTRYYDPDTGRFISPDAFLSTGQGILGNNMFAYCLNNPMRFMDPSGTAVIETVIVLKGLATLAGIVLITALFDPNVQAGLQEVVNELYSNTVEIIASIGELVAPKAAIKYSIPKVAKKEESSAQEIETIKTNNSKKSSTYYHATTPEIAILIKYSRVLKGSIYEGGYVFAWLRKPNKYAVNNSGARGNVIISFETTASFEEDWGINNWRVRRYGPVRSTLPGPILISNVKILGSEI